MRRLDAQSSPCLELPQEGGTKLQIQASILDGRKRKIGSEDIGVLCILPAHVPSTSFSSFFLGIFLPRPIKKENVLHVGYDIRLKAFATGHLSPLVQDPMYIFNINIFSGRFCRAC